MKTKILIIVALFSAIQALAMNPPLDQNLLHKAATAWSMSVDDLMQSFSGQDRELRELLATYREEVPQISVAPVVDDQFHADAALALKLSMLPDDDETFGERVEHNAPISDELLTMSKIHNIDVPTLQFLKENDRQDFDQLRNSAFPVEPAKAGEAIKVIEDAEELTSDFWWTLQLDDQQNTHHKLVFNEGFSLGKHIKHGQAKILGDLRKSFEDIWSFNCHPDKISHILFFVDYHREIPLGKNEAREFVSKMVTNETMSVEQGIRLLDYFGGPSWVAYRMMSIAPKRSIIEIMERFPKEYNVFPNEATEMFRRSFNVKYGFSKGSFADGIVPPAMRIKMELKKILGGDSKEFVVSDLLVDSVYTALKGTKFLFVNEFAQNPRELNEIEINDILVFIKNDAFTLKPWDQVISQGIFDSKIGAQEKPINAPVAKDQNITWKAAAKKFMDENGEQNLNYFYDAFSSIYGCGAHASLNSPGKVIEDLLLYDANVKQLSAAGVSVKELIFQMVSDNIFVINEVERKLSNDEVDAIIDYVMYNEFYF